MTTPELAARHYDAEVRRAESARLLARKRWRTLGAAGLDAGWSRIAENVAAILALAQLGAASSSAAYVQAALEEASQDVAPLGRVRPEAWSGIASDGRALDGLLYSAVISSRQALTAGLQFDEALLQGERTLDRIMRTQVADAGRGAAGAAIAARPAVGYTRMASPPCCQRCAVLVGRFFKWNKGFDRHPNCDCRHVPTGENRDGYVGAISPDQVRDLTIAQRRAIADGADMNQVINARRGRSKDRLTTTEGTTRRGYASYVRRQAARQKGEQAAEVVQRPSGRRNATRVKPRLTPEAIYRFSSSREEAVRLLARNGYIVGDIAATARRAA